MCIFEVIQDENLQWCRVANKNWSALRTRLRTQVQTSSTQVKNQLQRAWLWSLGRPRQGCFWDFQACQPRHAQRWVLGSVKDLTHITIESDGKHLILISEPMYIVCTHIHTCISMRIHITHNVVEHILSLLKTTTTNIHSKKINSS